MTTEIKGKVVPIEDLKPTPRKNRSEFLGAVYTAVESLEPGTAFVFAPPGKLTAKEVLNRLGAAFNSRKPRLPEGCVLKKRTEANGHVALLCVVKPQKAPKSTSEEVSENSEQGGPDLSEGIESFSGYREPEPQ